MADAYHEHHSALDVGGYRIPTALTLPGESRLESAILLVPGSLFSDVNGDYPAWQIFPHVYAHLARQLSARGHAVLRFAKLGPGTGSTVIDENVAPTVRGWGGRLVIATAMWRQLAEAIAGRGLHAPRMVVAGHSEGSVVAELLATSDLSVEIDGVALMSGPAVGIFGIMREQLALTYSARDLENARRDFDAGIVQLRAEGTISARLLERPALRGMKTVGPGGWTYLADCDATDPLTLAVRISQPVLVVQGGRDSSVPAHHADRLLAALESRRHSTVEMALFPELQHMYKRLPDGMDAFAGFGLPGPTDERVTDAIDEWIRRAVPIREG